MSRDRLTVEWQHVRGAKGGACQRCTGTGHALRELEEELAGYVSPEREVSITETILPADALEISNRVLVNGVPVEELIEDARVETTACEGCGEIRACCEPGDGPADCRAVVVDGTTHEVLGPELLRDAIDVALERG